MCSLTRSYEKVCVSERVAAEMPSIETHVHTRTDVEIKDTK